MSDSDIDLVQLWVLNHLVLQQVNLGRIVLFPNDETGLPYWDFPHTSAWECEPSVRLNKVAVAHASGELALFEKYSEANTIGYAYRELSDVGGTVVERGSAAANFMAVITEKGHRRWEDEFCPDWRRYWSYEEVSYEQDGMNTFEITCATAEMLSEVLEGISAYFWGVRDCEIRLIDKRTAFGVQVSFWKVLQTAVQARVKIVPPVQQISEGVINAEGVSKARRTEISELLRLSDRW